MKLRVIVDMDVSETMAETIRRNGFNVCADGSGMQVQVPHSPNIPRRKTDVQFVEEPQTTLQEVVDSSNRSPE